MSAIKQWFQDKFITPARVLSSAQIGLAIAVGLWGGVFPIPACSTFATAFLCSTVLYFAFNTPMTSIALSVNLAATPLQFVLMPVFLGLVGFPISNASHLVELVKSQSVSDSVAIFGKGFLWASLLWAMLAPVTILLLQYTVMSVLKLMISKPAAH